MNSRKKEETRKSLVSSRKLKHLLQSGRGTPIKKESLLMGLWEGRCFKHTVELND